MKRRLLSLLLSLGLCLSLLSSALAVEHGLSAGDMAEKLETLGLLRGVGENEDGSTDFALDREATRAQAVTMLVRLLGGEAEAEAMGKTHPFTDVPAWADGAVSYVYEKGLTKGVSETRFGSDNTVTAEMYATFMLRVLGYEDGVDFTWDNPWVFATEQGVLPPGTDDTNGFYRGYMVRISCAALFSSMKDSDDLLWEDLAQQGVFTEEAFVETFPEDPYVALHQQPDYLNALLEIYRNGGRIDRVWETDQFTLVEKVMGGLPHGHNIDCLTLVYKAGSQLGEGTVVDLPTMYEEFGHQLSPYAVLFDGDTMLYRYELENPCTDMSGEVLYEAGVYTITVDLLTGEASAPVKEGEF